MEMKLNTEDDNNLEKYLVGIAGELDAILKAKVSSCQLMKFSFFRRRGLEMAWEFWGSFSGWLQFTWVTT